MTNQVQNQTQTHVCMTCGTRSEQTQHVETGLYQCIDVQQCCDNFLSITSPFDFQEPYCEENDESNLRHDVDPFTGEVF